MELENRQNRNYNQLGRPISIIEDRKQSHQIGDSSTSPDLGNNFYSRAESEILILFSLDDYNFKYSPLISSGDS